MHVLANIPKSINLIIYTNWLKKLHDHLNQCKKVIWQDSTLCHDKNLIECRTKGSRLQHSKVYVWQTQRRMTTNVILNGEFLKSIPLKSVKHQGCSVSPLIFNMVHKALAEETQQEREIKEILMRKVKSPLFAHKRPPNFYQGSRNVQHFQQSCRIEDQLSERIRFSIYYQQALWE